MPSEDRRDLSTAAVGATGLGAGGLMRHQAVSGIKPTPKVHLIGVLRNGTRGQKKLFAAGSTLGLLSAVPLGVGVTNFASGRGVDKRDQSERGFWSEGLRGSASALRQRGENVVQPVPAQVRGAQLGVAAGAGLGGSALTRALLPKGVRPVAGPIAGALAATGSLPITNKIVARHGYVVTPYGAKRAKTAPVRPSSKASRHRPEHRSLRQDLAKKDTDYLGARTSYNTQRAAVTAANRTPIVGNFLSTGVASRYAPPGQERKAGVRQFAMGSAAPMAAGVGGAYGGAHWADTSDRGLKAATGVINAKDKVERSVRSAVRMGPKKPMNPAGWRARQLARVAQSRLGKPLLKSPRATIGAIGGFVGAKAIAGTVGEQSAITLNQHDQSAYNRKHNIAKLASDQGTKRERHRLAERKRLNAALAYTSGGLGLTGLGLMAAGKHPVAMKTSILAGGVGGTNSLIGAGVQRREATQVDPGVHKRDYKEPLRTSISEDDARKLIERHGLTGPLPKQLDREQRRAAYEARYTTAGGHKAEHWQHRAVMADKAKMAGLGVATAAGVPWLGARTNAGRRLGTAVARHVPSLRKVKAARVEHHAENVAGTAAVAAGGAELYAAHARRRRSSYASAPAGVAASALRRMAAYDTEAS